MIQTSAKTHPTDPEIAMNPNPRAFRFALLLTTAALVLLALAPALRAQAPAETLTVEQYIEQARPYLDLSCERAWTSVEGDGQAYVDILNKIAPIGFINHGFDVAKLQALPADELEALRVEYYNEIGRLCRDDPQGLLAGVVEHALVFVFDKIDG